MATVADAGPGPGPGPGPGSGSGPGRGSSCIVGNGRFPSPAVPLPTRIPCKCALTAPNNSARNFAAAVVLVHKRQQIPAGIGSSVQQIACARQKDR